MDFPQHLLSYSFFLKYKIFFINLFIQFTSWSQNPYSSAPTPTLPTSFPHSPFPLSEEKGSSSTLSCNNSPWLLCLSHRGRNCQSTAGLSHGILGKGRDICWSALTSEVLQCISSRQRPSCPAPSTHEHLSSLLIYLLGLFALPLAIHLSYMTFLLKSPS